MEILHAGCYPVVMRKTEYYGDSTYCMLASCNVQDSILWRFFMLMLVMCDVQDRILWRFYMLDASHV
jgi:hypothetical protein